jgi:3-phosphoglycerate kinase
LNKLTIRDWDLLNKTTLVRVDYNVSFNEEGKIVDDTRIRATLPTLDYLLKNNCRIILISHMGRPKGKVVPSLSLKPVAEYLTQLLKRKVTFVSNYINKDKKEIMKETDNGQLVLLENLRFYPEEEANDLNFAKHLASLAEVFVQDAFGAVHRAHASVVGVPKFLPTVAGLLLEKELCYLSDAMENPEHPFLAIIGGNKISSKIGIIKNLLNKVDSLIIGGGMAYTFLKTYGAEVGNSIWEQEKLDLAKEILKEAKEKKVRFFLPIDHLIAKQIEPNTEVKETNDIDIPDGWMGVDIGPLSIDRFAPIIAKAKTIFWNGPMGIFEIDKFASGSVKIAQLVAQATKNGTMTIAGGGATVTVANMAGVQNKISHLSTGGGATLEFIEGKELPGITTIKNKEKS